MRHRSGSTRREQRSKRRRSLAQLRAIFASLRARGALDTSDPTLRDAIRSAAKARSAIKRGV